MNDHSEKIRQYQIWLIGDRCDGWERAAVEHKLRNLLQEQMFNEYFQSKQDQK